MLAVEVGHGLVPLIDPAQDGEIVDRIQGIENNLRKKWNYYSASSVAR